MHSDQRHPGWPMMRPKVNPWRRTTSTRVLSGVRSSSGLSWDFTSNFETLTFGMETSFTVRLLVLRSELDDSEDLPAVRSGHDVRLEIFRELLVGGDLRHRGPSLLELRERGHLRLELES